MKMNHINPAWKWCLLFALFALMPLAAQDAGEIVKMNAFEVRTTIAKYRWTYAKSRYFEILSSHTNKSFISSIVHCAEQIIATFETRCPIFHKKNDLPAKLIFINDQGIGRFLNNVNLQHRVKVYIPAPIGIYDAGEALGIKTVAATGYYDDEQIVLLKLITPENEYEDEDTIRLTAIDVAIAYMQTCLRPYIDPDKALWLETTLDTIRGHRGGMDRDYPISFNSKTYGWSRKYGRDGSLMSFSRPGWFAMDDKSITLGRYCLACDIGMYRKASNYKNRPETWSGFMTGPYINLGEVLKSRDYRKELRGDMKTIDYRQTLLREAIDFTYYCIFGPDPKDRAAFGKFVSNLKKFSPGEELFIRHFGAGYDEFHEKIYVFMHMLGRDAPEYAGNPWGPAAFMVKRPAQSTGNRVNLEPSTRLCTARIVADWFALCGADAMALQTLRNAAQDLDPEHDDPEFAAALGLIEAEHGDKTKAMALLEKAVAANTARPRAYRELSQLKLEIMKTAGDDDKRSPDEKLNSAVQPLLAALKQPWTNPKNHLQLAQIWRRTNLKPPKDILGVIALGCRQFPDSLDLLEEAVPLLAGNGYPQAARQLLDHADRQVLSDEEKARLGKLTAKISETEP